MNRDLPADQAANASLAGLLRIDEAAPLDWSDADLASIWSHQLQVTLADELPNAADAWGQQTFGQLLADPSPSLEALQAVKSFSKSAGASGETLPRDVAAVLYLAAIAAAAVRLGQSITQTPSSQLLTKLQWAAERPWIDDSTRRIFANFG